MKALILSLLCVKCVAGRLATRPTTQMLRLEAAREAVAGAERRLAEVKSGALSALEKTPEYKPLKDAIDEKDRQVREAKTEEERNTLADELLTAKSALHAKRSEINSLPEVVSAQQALETATQDLVREKAIADENAKTQAWVARKVHAETTRLFIGENLNRGEVGVFRFPLTVLQVIGPKEMLVQHGEHQTLWLNGWPTDNVVDGEKSKITKPVKVAKQRQYESASGATRTVWEIHPAD